jgi:hypothetical protein
MIEFAFKKKNRKYNVLVGFYNGYCTGSKKIYDIIFWFDRHSYYEVASYRLKTKRNK